LNSGTTNAGINGGFQQFNGDLYFSAYTADGYELVRLAPGGALTSYDINPGPGANSIPGEFGGFAAYPQAGPILASTAGNDILAGTGDHDTFVFKPNFGHDLIENFASGTDVIEIDHTLFADFAAISDSAHMQQVGADTVITLDTADTITLQNI